MPECSHCQKALNTKRCTGCQKAYFCDSQCQGAAWASHRVFCKCAQGVTQVLSPYIIHADLGQRAREREKSYSISETPQQVSSPYVPGLLPEDLNTTITIIRRALRSWLALSEECQAGKRDLDERLFEATWTIANLQIPAPYAFVPQRRIGSKAKQIPVFISAFTSIVKAYWIALLTTLDDTQRTNAITYLDIMPPFQDRVPQFDGKKCVEDVESLTLKEFEGLMRSCSILVAQEVAGNDPDVVASWMEVAEAGVQLWEE